MASCILLLIIAHASDDKNIKLIHFNFNMLQEELQRIISNKKFLLSMEPMPLYTQHLHCLCSITHVIPKGDITNLRHLSTFIPSARIWRSMLTMWYACPEKMGQLKHVALEDTKTVGPL
ncbi:hypothetical protein ACJX0J_036573 [Zea mays]